ncbi:DsbA family protein [Candidatus Microgenomates bacterium]|nr:DsbA family protein [Candidatus Microgenomates bacterium]
MKSVPNLLTLILITLLVVCAFLIGMFWTKVQTLEKGVAVSGTPTLRPAPPVLSADKFNEVVKEAIFVGGDPNSKVKLVEFADFQCPVCGNFFTNYLPTIEKEYIDTKKIGFYIRHFPLYSLHPDAENAALAMECAREQDKFKALHDVLFQNQQSLSTTDLKKYAAQLQMKTSQFNACLDSKKYKANIDRDVKLGESLGVTGTPNFFLNGRLIAGISTLAAFQVTLDEELKK